MTFALEDPASMPLPTIGESVRDASSRLAQAGLASPRLDARLLMATALGLSKESVIASEPRSISWDAHCRFEALVDRRLAHEPVAYIRGIKEFWSLEMDVAPGVLIPRPDTEILVRTCLDVLGETGPGTILADVGTGSGAVAVALARELPAARVLAVDVSEAAASVARRNAAKHGVEDRVAVVQAHLTSCVGDAALTGIAANLPYVATREIDGLDPGIRDHEPRVAIDGGADGLDLVRLLMADAPRCLVRGGLLALEVADGQVETVMELLEAHGSYTQVQAREDLGRLKRVVSARSVA